MSKLSEKIAYLKGISEGMKPEGKMTQDQLMEKILDVLQETVAKIDEMDENIEELSDFVDVLDSDLEEMEEAITEIDDYDYDEDDDDFYDEEELIYECPNCGCEITLESSDIDMDSDPKCPECGKSIFPEDEESENND